MTYRMPIGDLRLPAPQRKISGSVACVLATGMALALASGSPATAHPHVFVTTESMVVIESNAISAIQQKWTFDELYTSMAIQGLDKNGDGKYDREELAELAKINMDGLKEFAYFTYARLKDADLKVSEPKEAWLEHADGILSLHFKLPLAEAVPLANAGFSYQVADPSFYIAFEPAKTDPVKLSAGAPQTCKIELGEAKKEAPGDLQRLGEAFATQLGASGGFGVSKTISVNCGGS